MIHEDNKRKTKTKFRAHLNNNLFFWCKYIPVDFLLTPIQNATKSIVNDPAMKKYFAFDYLIKEALDNPASEIAHFGRSTYLIYGTGKKLTSNPIANQHAKTGLLLDKMSASSILNQTNQALFPDHFTSMNTTRNEGCIVDQTFYKNVAMATVTTLGLGVTAYAIYKDPTRVVNYFLPSKK